MRRTAEVSGNAMAAQRAEHKSAASSNSVCAQNGRQQVVDFLGIFLAHRPETRVDARGCYPGKLYGNQDDPYAVTTASEDTCRRSRPVVFSGRRPS